MDLFATTIIIITIFLSLIALGYIIFIIFFHPYTILKEAPLNLMDPCPIGRCIRANSTSPCERTMEGQYTCENLPSSNVIIKEKNRILLIRNAMCPNCIGQNFCLENTQGTACLECPSKENGQSYFQCPLKGQDSYENKRLYYTPSLYTESNKGICQI